MEFSAQAVFEDHNQLMFAGALPMWTIYANPIDRPGRFVARKFLVAGGHEPIATSDVLEHADVAVLRALFREAGLTALPRQLGDEPHIVEVWL